MSSAVNDNGITNNGLVGVSSASQIGNDNNLFGNSARDDFLDRFPRDIRGYLPSWFDWLTGYDRAFDNSRYEQWLSDTSIRRRVADAKLAGINPLFAISGGSGADGASTLKRDTSGSGPKDLMSIISKIALMFMLFG